MPLPQNPHDKEEAVECDTAACGAACNPLSVLLPGFYLSRRLVNPIKVIGQPIIRPIPSNHHPHHDHDHQAPCRGW
jgi:hypothetical protein